MRITGGALAVMLASTLLTQTSGHAARSADRPGDAVVTIVERLAAMESPLTSYRALRTLTAEARGGQMRGRITAWTTLDPIAGFQYTIVDEEGSALIRRKVLQGALETERRMGAAGRADGAVTPRNYDFLDSTRTADGLLRVSVRPKRRDVLLVEGAVLLTDPECDLVRVEGRLSDQPSAWTRDVQIVRRYARINGVRVPVETQSVARLLLVGRSTFSMTYEYASINGTPVRTEKRAMLSRQP